MVKGGCCRGLEDVTRQSCLISNTKINPCDRLAESITPTHRQPSKSTSCMAMDATVLESSQRHGINRCLRSH
jgi:hypothetical protein